MATFGYARVSTDHQDTALQLDALVSRGVDEGDVFTDTMSGARDDRPGLEDAIQALQPGDKLVVWRIDRLSRSLRHLLDVAERIHAQGAALVSICEVIDLSTPAGRLVFGMLGAVAQFERDVIAERTRAGLAAAKARGVRLGASSKLPEGSDQWESVRRMLLAGIPGHRIAADHKISPATIYKAFPGGRGALLEAERMAA